MMKGANIKNHRMPLVQALLLLGMARLYCDRSIHASDVSAYVLLKGLEFSQAGTSFPIVEATNGYTFEADVVMSGNSSVKSASIQPPGTISSVALVLSASQKKWSFKHRYNSQKTLDKHYPNGSYTFTIDARQDGYRQVALPLSGNLYPNGPFIRNLPATQAANANGYVEILWDRFGEGSPNGYIQFRVQDLSGNKVFETPDLNNAGALDGTATRTLVAPGTLSPGLTYRDTLLFQEAATLDSRGMVGALGESAYFSRTTFDLITTLDRKPDVKMYEVSKGRRWVQAGAGQVAPEIGAESFFEASVQAYDPGILGSGTVLLPLTTNAPSRNLALQPGGTDLDFSDAAPTQASLDMYYGNGNYTLAFGTPHEGNKSLTLSVSSDAFPPAPQISNFNLLQTVDASQPLTISWDSWVGGGINDSIRLRIQDAHNNPVFETPALGKAGSLDGRTTHVDVPAGLLLLGQTYSVRLIFKRFLTLDTTTYPAVLGLSDVYAQTKFKLQTRAGLAGSPFINHESMGPGQVFQLSIKVTPGLTYRIDGSGNLVQWIPLATNIASSENLLFQDANSSLRPSFFYRALWLR